VSVENSPPKPVTGSQPAAPPTGSHPAAERRADPHERIDGLRAWLAQVDRKLGIRTYAIGAAAVLALAAGIVGVVLALQNQDDTSTVKDDVRSLRTQIGADDRSASQAAEDQVQALTGRLDQLDNRIKALESEGHTTDQRLQVAEDDIDDLRNQISDLQSNQPAGSNGGSGGTGSP
jgi:septal ring factor EnvC (AmiA/AmiB activator)